MSSEKHTRRQVGRQVATVPNAICGLRILLTPVLLVLAVRDQRVALLVTYLVMTFTDWLDGKLAVLLDQRSAFGARLDSLADLLMYATLMVGVVILDGPRLERETLLLALAVGSYLLAGVVGLAKFGKWPSYHTGLAKISWFCVLVGASLFLLAPTGVLGLEDGPLARWPLRFALLVVLAGNLQSLVITAVLPHWRSDVRGIRAARSIRKEALDGGGH